MTQNNWFRLLLTYIEAYLVGTFSGLLPLALIFGYMTFQEEGLIDSIFVILVMPAIGALVAPIITLPAIILGYFISYALQKREISNVFLWVSCGVLTGVLNGFAFSLQTPSMIFMQAFVGGFVSYFMWRKLFFTAKKKQ